VAATLSVFKPSGRTRYGWRKLRRSEDRRRYGPAIGP
jgi:hypothetical protein